MNKWEPRLLGILFKKINDDEFEKLLEELVEILYGEICQQNLDTYLSEEKDKKCLD